MMQKRANKQSCAGLAGMGVAIDPEKNSQHDGGARDIRHRGSPVAVLVIPTNEEPEITVQRMGCLGGVV